MCLYCLYTVDDINYNHFLLYYYQAVSQTAAGKIYEAGPDMGPFMYFCNTIWPLSRLLLPPPTLGSDVTLQLVGVFVNV